MGSRSRLYKKALTGCKYQWELINVKSAAHPMTMRMSLSPAAGGWLSVGVSLKCTPQYRLPSVKSQKKILTSASRLPNILTGRYSRPVVAMPWSISAQNLIIVRKTPTDCTSNGPVSVTIQQHAIQDTYWLWDGRLPMVSLISTMHSPGKDLLSADDENRWR